MRRRRDRIVAAAAGALALTMAAPAAAQPDPQHEVNAQDVVWVVPGLDRVTVRKDIPFKQAGPLTLGLDLYYPADYRPADFEADRGAGAKRPAVVFINGVGDGPGGRLKDWGIYQSWGRTVAASGWIGVTFSSRGPATGSGPDIADLFAFLAKEGAPLGIDTSRIAAWVCSANVTSGLKFLMDQAGRGIVGAVVYYGDSDPAKIRTDLPIYYVRAGRDNPDLNARIDRLWARALAAGAPWEMVNASESHHAFDALDETEESRRVVRETLAFYRDLFQPPPPPPATNAARRALSFWFGHEYAKAEAAYGEFLKTHPNDATAWMRLGLSQAYTKQPAAAEASLEKAISLGANGPVDLYNVACAYAVLGEKDRAIQALGRAVDAGFRDRGLAERDQDLASLRGDERFQKLLARIGAS